MNNLTGGNGDDTFVAISNNDATINTLTTGDSLSGSNGTDTLSISVSGSASSAGTFYTNSVENLAVQHDGSTAQYTVNASNMTGLMKVWLSGGAAANDLVVSGTKSLVALSLSATDQDISISQTNASVTQGTSDAVAIAISAYGTGSGSNPTITYDGVETFNIASTGVASGNTSSSSASTVALSSTALKTVNITGDAGVRLSATFSGASTAADVGMLDASAATGAVNATLTAGASKLMSIKGGAGNDAITVSSVANADLSKVTVDGGTGTDTLTVGTVTAATSGTQPGANVSGFETIAATSMSQLAFPNNTFTGSSGVGTFSKMGATYASATLSSTGTLTTTRGTDTAADSLAVSLTGSSGTSYALSVVDEETLTVASAGTGAAATHTLSSVTATDLTKLVVTGSRGLTITTLTAPDLAEVDASGNTGQALTIDASGSSKAMKLTGSAGAPTTAGSKVNDLTGSTGADTITGGAYADDLDGGAGADLITGGGGSDTLIGGIGSDTIVAGDGNDSINAGANDDKVTAGGGNDTIDAGSGADTIDAGAGNDTIYMTGINSDDVIDGGAGTDSMRGSSSSTSYIAISESGASPTITSVESGRFSITSDSTLNSTAALSYVFDMTKVTGMTAATFSLVDSGSTDFQTIKNFPGTSATLNDTNTLDTLTFDGVGQAVTLNLNAYSGGKLTVTGVAGLTVSANSTDSTTGTDQANDLALLTATTASGLTVKTTGSNAAQSNPNEALFIDGDVTVTSAELLSVDVGARDTLVFDEQILATDSLMRDVTITVGTSGVVNFDDDAGDGDEIDLGSAAMQTLTITTGTAASIYNGTAGTAVVIDADSVAKATITIGSSSAISVDLPMAVTAGTASIGYSGTWDLEVLGQAGAATSMTVSGDGDITSNNVIALYGSKVTFNASALMGTNGFDVNGTALSDASTIRGGAGANVLIGGAGNDTISGGGDADTLVGDSSTSTFTVTAMHTSNTTATLALSGVSVTATLTGGATTATGAAAIATAINASAGASSMGFSATSSGAVVTITHPPGATLTATTNSASSSINTTGTNSTTAAASAVSSAASGVDSLTGGEGADTIFAGAGNDVIDLTEVVSAADNVYLLSGSDTISGFTTTVDDLFVGTYGVMGTSLGSSVAVNQSSAATTGSLFITTNGTGTAYLAADIVALLATTQTAAKFTVGASSKYIVVVNETSAAGTSTGTTQLWYVNNDGTPAVVAGEVSLIGTVTVADTSGTAAALVSGDFGG